MQATTMFAQEFRHSLRALQRSFGFALTAVLTLAIGIGTSTAMFMIVDSVLLQPLRYRDSGRLVAVWEQVQTLALGPIGPNPRHVDFWTKRSKTIESFALVQQASIGLSIPGADHPQLVGVVSASAELFNTLQVKPLLGHGFLPEQGLEARDSVAVLSYSLWQNSFGGDPQIIGKTVRLGEVSRQVVGVLPPQFHFPNRNALRAFQSKQTASHVPEPSIFVPVAFDWKGFSWNGEYGNWVALARLRTGVRMQTAQSELDAIEAQLVASIPTNERDSRPGALRAFLQPLQHAVVGEVSMGLWLLLAAVLGLLGIGCVNLANAQMARSLTRSREASVRAALGATRWSLVRSVLLENLILASAGGLLGVWFAQEALALLRLSSPVDLPRLAEVSLNGTVLLVSAGLMMGAAVLFSVLPALRVLRGDLQVSARATGSRQTAGLHRWLIGAQVFGCTVLLLVTGFFTKSLMQVMTQEKGFETEQVAVAQINISAQTYGSPKSRVALIDSIVANLREVPGVQVASFVSAMPLEGESWIESVRRDDRPTVQQPLMNLRWVGPGYFETMRHKLVAGRFFEERDRDAHSVILSEAQARSLWPDSSPIGGLLTTQGRQFTVIGVVADSRISSLKAPPTRTAYLHYRDRSGATLYFVARGVQQPSALVPEMRAAIWRHSPDLTIVRSMTLEEQVRESLATERFQTFVLMSFGGCALLLAMLGIYGILSYSVASHRQEIGIRMALGADRRQIYRDTLGEVFTPVFVGLGCGLIASLGLVMSLKRLIYGVKPFDPALLLAVSALFLVAAGVAGYLPARRAASVDPMEALRME